jgi:CRP-like cAMP-binding protein
MNLKTFQLFAELDDHDRRVLGDHLEQQRVPAGHCLFREGDAASALVLVAKGRLEVESGRTGELGSLGRGAWLGEASLVSVGSREATVTAAKNSVILRLERSSMRVMLEESPRTAARLIEALAGSLASTLRCFVEDVAVDRAAPDA